MHPKSTAVPMLVLTACVLMCACTTVDKFTMHDIGNWNEEPPSLNERSLVLKGLCKYVAGSDISGSLSPGPLQPDAIATPAPSNSRIKETIYLIHIGDLPIQGMYNIASFIGVKQNGSFVQHVLLHSDVPGASPFVNENDTIRFSPKNCHYAMVNTQGIH